MGEERGKGGGVEQSGEQVEVVAVRWRRGGKGGDEGNGGRPLGLGFGPRPDVEVGSGNWKRSVVLGKGPAGWRWRKESGA